MVMKDNHFKAWKQINSIPDNVEILDLINLKDKQIAELELYSRKMAQQIMEQSKRSKKTIEEISDLKKENEELKTGLKRISDKLDIVKKDWREHESLDKLREQKLANAENETIDKAIAEIDIKLKLFEKIIITINAPNVRSMINEFDELKSALLSMKKEAKSG